MSSMLRETSYFTLIDFSLISFGVYFHKKTEFIDKIVDKLFVEMIYIDIEDKPCLL